MRALTILQPYAELIARGAKWIENRTWASHYRGPLAIHAGQSPRLLRVENGRDEYGLDPQQLAFGAIVAVAELLACLSLAELQRQARAEPLLPGRRRTIGDTLKHLHCEGPVLWILADVQRLATPVPCRGAQGLFTLPPAVQCEVRRLCNTEGRCNTQGRECV